MLTSLEIHQGGKVIKINSTHPEYKGVINRLREGKPVYRICPNCKKLFVPIDGVRMYCSEQCKNKVKNATTYSIRATEEWKLYNLVYTKYRRYDCKHDSLTRYEFLDRLNALKIKRKCGELTTEDIIEWLKAELERCKQ